MIYLLLAVHSIQSLLFYTALLQNKPERQVAPACRNRGWRAPVTKAKALGTVLEVAPAVYSYKSPSSTPLAPDGVELATELGLERTETQLLSLSQTSALITKIPLFPFEKLF